MIGASSRAPGTVWQTARQFALVAATVALASCFQGAELEDKEPPPGYPGGACLQGDACDDGVCHESGACYDPNDPCKGFFCGGNGECWIDSEEFFPYCECDPGYDNSQYLYFCTPAGS